MVVSDVAVVAIGFVACNVSKYNVSRYYFSNILTSTQKLTQVAECFRKC